MGCAAIGLLNLKSAVKTILLVHLELHKLIDMEWYIDRLLHSTEGAYAYHPKSKLRKRFHAVLAPAARQIRSTMAAVFAMIPALPTVTVTTSDGRRHRVLRRGRVKRRFNATRVFHSLATMTIAMGAAADKSTCARLVRFDTDSKDLYIDNCCTTSITNDPRDCVGPMVAVRKRVKGVAGTRVTDMFYAPIEWTIEDDRGQRKTIRIRGLYIPSAPTRLLSPQQWAQEACDTFPLRYGTRCVTLDDSIILEWDQRTHTRTIPLNRRGTNVARISTCPDYKEYHAFHAKCSHGHDHDNDPLTANDATVIPDGGKEDQRLPKSERFDQVIGDFRQKPLATDFNLDGPAGSAETPPTVVPDEEDHITENASALALKWHHRLGHASMRKLQFLARLGLLPKVLATCDEPICTACLFGKATRRPWRNKPKKGVTKSAGTVTAPGQVVSIDQLVSTTPGLIGQLRGIPTKKRYTAATVFVDQYSRLSYIHLQKSTSAADTIEAKQAFERYAKAHGVTIGHYHGDNGIFADNRFRKACADAGQTLSFCGVNAHFQNGIAERRIREIQDHARTQLIHAAKRWPAAVNAHLWPYALRHANDLHNHLPSVNGEVPPMEKFSGSPVTFNPDHYYSFAAPVYVLDRQMQAGRKIGKWTERARVGLYLGMSPEHARSVPLILDLKHGLVSPQFHISVDTTFQTMRRSFGNEPPKSMWQAQCHFLSPEAVKPPKKRKAKYSLEERQAYQAEKRRIQETELDGLQQDPPAGDSEIQAPEGAIPQLPPAVQAPEGAIPPLPAPEGAIPPLPPEVPLQDPSTREGPYGAYNDPVEEPEGVYEQEPFSDSNLRRSPRIRRSTERWLQYLEATNPSFVAYESIAYMAHEIDPLDDAHPITAFKATSDPDTLYLHQAKREDDWPEFLKAMAKEVDDHTKNGLWEIVPKRKLPQGSLVAPGIWAMKRKRHISTGEAYKWKARLAYDGSKQTKGVNYWETYAPVASWSTIRLVLSLAQINKWKIRQVDFVLAYTQAEAECDMYMKIPREFEVADGKKGEEYVLKIKKNYYGQKQAGRVWNKYLVAKLLEVGFEQSEQDECLFYKGDVVYALYTDDSLLSGPDDKTLDDILKQMEGVGLKLTSEVGVGDFLGVKIDRVSDTEIHLTQPQLIDSILRDLDLIQRPGQKEVTTKDTPAAISVLLRRHLDSAPFDHSFDYRSVIGKLNYLEQSTRPDISYATHQCARFCSDPRWQHGKAVRWIGRYLLATRDKGIILKPTDDSFVVYCDSDFSGNWNQEEAHSDADTARSRSGFIIMYRGCPICWLSKLQTDIALSTTEAEYTCLSTALRTAIPLIGILKEMQARGFDVPTTTPKAYCRVFEDNSGAIQLATVFKMRPRTKHINTRYHHFRAHVTRGDITIHPIDSENQAADYLTKPSPVVLFERHRMMIQGW
jgi:hypothetical protein